MDGATWCAAANLTHPEAVIDVHRAYLAAGAEIITANTYATSPLLFSALDRSDEVGEIDRVAVALAREAAGPDIQVAGSFSVMRLVGAGTDRTRLDVGLAEREAKRLLRAKADGLAEAGVDFILMEMMRDADYSLWATEAAVATGLPVWLGVAAERADNGTLIGFGRPDMPLHDIVGPLCDTGVEQVSVMHTAINDIDAALDVVRRVWRGPVGVYPESGYFAMPDWQFVDIIGPDDLVQHSRTWVAGGVTLVGGCCGIGPEHIEALAREHGHHG